MKAVKIILLSMEFAMLLGIIILAFSFDNAASEENFFKSMYISLFSIGAVVLQKEQQSIEWNEEEG